MAARCKSASAGGEALESLAAVSVSTADFAAMVGLSQEALRLRIKSGAIPRTGHGRMNLVSAVHGLIAYEKAKAEEAKVRSSNDSRVLYMEAKAREIEGRHAREMEKLISFEDVECAFSLILAAVASEAAKSNLQRHYDQSIAILRSKSAGLLASLRAGEDLDA